MQALSVYRSTDAGLPDLLNYAALVDEGIILGKDGSLMAGFFFRGDDAGSASDADLNYISAMVSTYLAKFDSGWCMWVDAVRLPSPGYPAPSQSHFPDPISALIDMERREMFERQDTHFESEFALVLQYLPPTLRESKFGELLYDDEGRDDSLMGDRILASFKSRIKDFEDGLGRLLNMTRMGSVMAGPEDDKFESDQLVNYLRFCMTGENIALRIPDCPMYLDAWLGHQGFWHGDTPKLGDKFIACVAIEGFPSKSIPGMLSLFEHMAVSYRWSTRFIFMDRHEALAQLDRYHKAWTQNTRGFKAQLLNYVGVINKDAVTMVKEIEDAIANVKSGVIGYGHYTPVVVLMSKSRKVLEEQAAYVKKVIESKGFAARVEESNTTEAWRGSLPGHAYPNIRRPLIHTLNLADLLPLSAIWPGLRENPCSLYPAGSPPLMHAITTGNTPFCLNLHVDDVGHTLIFGPTGAGKSLLLALIQAQFQRYQGRVHADGYVPPATGIAIDIGRSLYALCSAMGGTHYDIGSDKAKNLTLCPLADIDDLTGALWAEEWIAICYALQRGEKGEPLTPHQRNEIHRAISRLRDAPRNARSITHFSIEVQDEKVKEAMLPYTGMGAMGHLLDGTDDSVRIAGFTVFEIGELMNMGDKNAVPVMLYLFRRIETCLKGQPTLLTIDEAAFMLGPYKEQLKKFLTRLRKDNCAVVVATHSLSSAVNSGIMDVLIEQCPTKIFLPNKEADAYGTKENPGPAQFYAMFGMNENEILMLKNAQYKKQYYYKSPLGRRIFELSVGPLTLAFVGLSDKDAIREVEALEEEYGPDWPLRHLEMKGVNFAKYLNQ